jgi:hypothetical protein
LQEKSEMVKRAGSDAFYFDADSGNVRAAGGARQGQVT